MLSQIICQHYMKDGKFDAKGREEVGKITSYVGILLNIGLSLIKMGSGWFFHSVSIVADGVNNLSDAGNSFVLLISFRLSSKPADEEHPFGHERIEYIASMIVGVSILILSFELFRSSFDKLIHPTPIDFSYVLLVVLLLSIIGKLWLYFFYKTCGEIMDSIVLKASAQDSKNDVLSTSAVLVSTLLFQFAQINLDGIMGIFVACLILGSGIEILKEAMNKILGEAPNKELVNYIDQKIRNYKGIYGTHDLMVHSYGQNRCFVSVHAEVDSREDVLVSHDLIDTIENDFYKEGIHVVIHMDPIVLDNPVINELADAIRFSLAELSNELRMHDFRAVLGETHSNLIFDCVIPYSCPYSGQQIEEHLQNMLDKKDHTYYMVITFERPFTY